MKILIDNNSPIKVDAEFYDGVNVIYGFSGTGKTLLFNKINDYYANCKDFRVSLIDYNYSDRKEELIADFCRNCDLVLLDNADLYLTPSLIDKLKTVCKCIVISMKNTLFFSSRDEVHVLSVEYNNHMIRTIKR